MCMRVCVCVCAFVRACVLRAPRTHACMLHQAAVATEVAAADLSLRFEQLLLLLLLLSLLILLQIMQTLKCSRSPARFQNNAPSAGPQLSRPLGKGNTSLWHSPTTEQRSASSNARPTFQRMLCADQLTPSVHALAALEIAPLSFLSGPNMRNSMKKLI